MNNRKILSIILIINILVSIAASLFCTKTYAAATVKQTTSSEINKIDEKKYPKIKEMIQDLQEKHPKWNFKVLYTGLNWEDVVNGEIEKHGVNVVSKSIYGVDWICKDCGANKTYSGGEWYCASKEAIAYMMDARNSLNETDLFQFLELSYDENVKYEQSAVKQILEGSFLDDGKLDTYVKQIMTSCKAYSVNPYFVAAKIIQEQGKKGGATFKMLGSSGNGKFKINEEKKVITVLLGTTVKNLEEYLGKKYVVKNTKKKEVKDGNAKVTTGYTVDKYTIAVLGDINKDGKIRATDYMEIKNYILQKSKLDNAQMLAADLNEDGRVRATDYMEIKNYILKKSDIKLEGEKYYYNIFNIRATGRTTEDIIKNALDKAKTEDWSTIEKCLDAGIKFIAEGYISIGQNSMYFEKFNVVNTTKGYSYYTHQYAQDLLYAQNQGTKLKTILKNIDAVDYPYTFIIPVYESMPENASVRPQSK